MRKDYSNNNETHEYQGHLDNQDEHRGQCHAYNGSMDYVDEPSCVVEYSEDGGVPLMGVDESAVYTYDCSVSEFHLEDPTHNHQYSGDVVDEYSEFDFEENIIQPMSGITNTVTVTLVGNGGTPATQTRIITRGSSLGHPLPAVSRDGYGFQGWWTAHTGGNQIFTNTPITSNLNLVVRWDQIPNVTITFDGNGGTPATQTRTVQAGQTIGDANMPTASRANHNFLGWWTTPSVGGFQITGTSHQMMENQTFFARWQQVTQTSWTVTFNSNGGSPNHGNRTVQNGRPLGQLPNVSRSGFTFMGWIDTSTDRRAYEHTQITANTNLVARWGRVIRWRVLGNVDFTWVREPGRPIGGGLPSVVREGFVFNGWYRTENDNSQSEAEQNDIQAFSGESSQIGPDYIMPNHDVDFFARLTPPPSNSIEVTLDPNGGNLAPGTARTRVVLYNSTMQHFPQRPNRPSHTFIGWWTERNGGRQVSSTTNINRVNLGLNPFNPAPTRINLYARWSMQPEILTPRANETISFNDFEVTWEPIGGATHRVSLYYSWDRDGDEHPIFTGRVGVSSTLIRQNELVPRARHRLELTVSRGGESSTSSRIFWVSNSGMISEIFERADGSTLQVRRFECSPEDFRIHLTREGRNNSGYNSTPRIHNLTYQGTNASFFMPSGNRQTNRVMTSLHWMDGREVHRGGGDNFLDSNLPDLRSAASSIHLSQSRLPVFTERVSRIADLGNPLNIPWAIGGITLLLNEAGNHNSDASMQARYLDMYPDLNVPRYISGFGSGRSRTFIGYIPGRNVITFGVMSSNIGSTIADSGTTYFDMHTYLLSLGCSFGMNLDGGGSTRFKDGNTTISAPYPNLTRDVVCQLTAVHLMAGMRGSPIGPFIHEHHLPNVTIGETTQRTLHAESDEPITWNITSE